MKRVIITAVLVVLAGAPAVYFYRQYQNVQLKLQNPTEAAKQEAQDITKAVGKLIELPGGEEPTVATVTDVTKLSDQAFFAQAQNGDKVLIYAKAAKAVLFRPSTNKIIEVAPVNIGSPTPSPVPTQAATTSGNL